MNEKLSHAEKLRLAGIARYGSEELWRDSLSKRAELSSRNKSGTGGFAHMAKHNPKRLKQIASDAGKKRHQA